MPNWPEIEGRVVAKGKVEDHDLEGLRQAVYADGKINREEADFLVDLYRRLRIRTPAFKQFFYQALKDHVLKDGRISAYDAAWLRQVVFADGKIDNDGRQFLRQLKWEAKEVSPEFEALYRESMRHAPG
jgi:hypothetical protein